MIREINTINEENQFTQGCGLLQVLELTKKV